MSAQDLHGRRLVCSTQCVLSVLTWLSLLFSSVLLSTIYGSWSLLVGKTICVKTRKRIAGLDR